MAKKTKKAVKAAKKKTKKTAKVAKKKTKKTAKVATKKTPSTRSAGSTRKQKALTAKELEHFKQLLLEKRRELIGDVNEINDEALKQSRLSAAGDLSSMPIHMADIGSDNFEQEFALGLLDGERRLLREIDSALQRTTDKTYGICAATGKPISKPRLEAQPWARHCVEYARMLEQGLVTESEETSD